MDKPGVEGLTIRKRGDVYTSVADVSCLERFDDEGGERGVVVAGIGMESWNVGGLKS